MNEKYEEEGMLYRSWLRARPSGMGGSSTPNLHSLSQRTRSSKFTARETKQPTYKVVRDPTQIERAKMSTSQKPFLKIGGDAKANYKERNASGDRDRYNLNKSNENKAGAAMMDMGQIVMQPGPVEEIVRPLHTIKGPGK